MLPWAGLFAPPVVTPVTVQRPNNPDALEYDTRGSTFRSESSEIARAKDGIHLMIDKVKTDIGRMRARETELVAVLNQQGPVSQLIAAQDELERVLRPTIRRLEAYGRSLDQLLEWVHQVEQQRPPTDSNPTYLSAAEIQARLRLL